MYRLEGHLLGVDDLEEEALSPARAARAHDRAEGARDSTVPPDHLPDLVRRDVEAEDDAVRLFHSLDAHLVGLVDELARQVLEEPRTHD